MDLDQQYSPSFFNNRGVTPAESVNLHIQCLTRGSDKAKQNVQCQLSVACRDNASPTDNPRVDIFAPDSLKPDCPVLLYIHGGYWQALSREQSSFMVEPLVSAGAAVICIGYDLAPRASMEEMVEQTTEAVEYSCAWAESRGSRGVYLCGHSAGAHLVTMVIANSKSCTTMNNIKGLIPVSGIFDLRPLVKTYVNEPIQMTETSAWECSPMKHIESIEQVLRDNPISVLIAYAECDPPSFRDDQSQAFYKILKKRGLNVDVVDIAGTDHFTVIEKLSEPDYILTKKLILMMGLNAE